MKTSPESFEAVSSKLQQLADALKQCRDATQRVAILKEFKRLLDQADAINEKLVLKSD